MVDAYKCQNCGTVVERPQNCPECGENSMQPTRVPESELHGSEDGDGDESEETAAHDDGPAGGGDDTTDGDSRTARRDRDTGGSEPSGLLGWLKSLF